MFRFAVKVGQIFDALDVKPLSRTHASGFANVDMLLLYDTLDEDAF